MSEQKRNALVCGFLLGFGLIAGFQGMRWYLQRSDDTKPAPVRRIEEHNQQREEEIAELRAHIEAAEVSFEKVARGELSPPGGVSREKWLESARALLDKKREELAVREGGLKAGLTLADFITRYYEISNQAP